MRRRTPGGGYRKRVYLGGPPSSGVARQRQAGRRALIQARRRVLSRMRQRAKVRR